VTTYLHSQKGQVMSTPQLNCPIIADYLDYKRLFFHFWREKTKQTKTKPKTNTPLTQAMKLKT
jgi:hypothetical protein